MLRSTSRIVSSKRKEPLVRGLDRPILRQRLYMSQNVVVSGKNACTSLYVLIATKKLIKLYNGYCLLMLKLHLFDLLWICCTTCCTTNPQQIHNKSKCLQQIHNKSKVVQHFAQTPLIRFVVDLLYNLLYNKYTTNPQVQMSTTNPQQIESCTTNLQHLDKSRCCGFVVDLS